MRIIAGIHRGRRLQGPPGRAARPMLDRVKEALFSTLGEALEGARVLDLFAGTGSLGLEALSRGASRVRFVEKAPAMRRVLRHNADLLGVGEEVEILSGDALAPSSWPEACDLVFCDPPYALIEEPGSRDRVLEAAAELLAGPLGGAGQLVLHTPRAALRADQLPAGLVGELREYGTGALWYLWPGGS